MKSYFWRTFNAMRFCAAVLFIFCIFVFSGCTYTKHQDPPPFRYVKPLEQLKTRADILADVQGTTYYLSGTGNDATGNGSQASPWRSLAKVQSVLKSGDCVILQGTSVNYGVFSDLTTHSEWVTYINDVGATPLFDGIRLRDNPVAPYRSLKIRFFGIKVLPVDVDPATSGEEGADISTYPASTSYTYAKTELPVDCSYVQDIEFYYCEMTGHNKHLTQKGINLSNVKNIRVERTHIHVVGTGITFTNTSDSYFYYNQVDEITGTHFQDGGYSSNIVIEGNHGYDRNWQLADPYCPRIEDYWYHGSYISIRSSNFIIRNNIFHNGGGSSGIMLYDDNSTSNCYSNILIENNLVYDTHSNYVLRMYYVGSNVIVRNNTFVGRERNTTFGARKYNTALAIHSFASGHDGSGLRLYNNIFVGISNIGSRKATILEDYNIFWSVENSEHNFYTQEQFESGSRVITSDETEPGYFLSGFFTDPLDISWPDMLTHDKDTNPNPPGHDLIRDYTLHAGSEAINFGDFLLGTSNSLGSLSGDGFVQLDGPYRDVDHHSAGCYE